MPEQGDKKIYIGDVWADRDKSEYQKKFIEDVLEVHQHHGFGFDADMVDGFHATDFATAQQGLLAETALQPFYLGETLIDNTFAHHYIGTEAVYILERTLEAIPWTKFNEEAPDDLTEAIEFLYKLLMKEVTNLDSKKVDKSCVKDNQGKCVKDENGRTRMQVLSDNNFEDHHKQTVEFLENQDFMVEVDCYNCPEQQLETQKKVVLNAGTINGLQFILITQDDYDDLPQTCKDNWRNMFIFVEEYPPEYDSPLNCSFENGFVFRVSNDGTKIQYKNKGNHDDNDWLDLIDIDDIYNTFWDMFSGSVDDSVINIINNDNSQIVETINELIQSETIYERLKIDTMDEDIRTDIRDNPDKYAFLSSELMDDFVYRIYCTLDSTKTYFPETLYTTGKYTFKEISLDNLVTDYQDKINAVKDLIPKNLKTSYNTLTKTTIPSLSRRISVLEGYNIPSINNTLNNTIDLIGEYGVLNNNTIFGKITSLENRVSALETKEAQRNEIHLFVGRWNSREEHDSDVTGNLGKIEMNMYDAGYAQIHGDDSEINPPGFYVRISNGLDPEASLGGDMGDYRVHVVLQGTKNIGLCMGRREEWWFASERVPSGIHQNSYIFGGRFKGIGEAQKNSNGQTYYSSGKVSIKWVDGLQKNDIAQYLLTATPYKNGIVCGNIVQIPIFITRTYN